MKDYIIIDTHCDTCEKISDNGYSLYKNTLNLDIHRMRKYKSYGQFFAAYISEQYCQNPQKRAYELINSLYSQINENSDKITVCKNKTDYLNAVAENKIPAFISVEGIGKVNAYELNSLYSKGVRMISLTHNNDNCLAGGCYGNNTGLTEVGKSTILEMNRLGIITDVSHISEKAFYDICATTTAPIIASHSNSFSLCPDKRNLSDEQFYQIKELGGVVGINYYPPFLNGTNTATIDDIVKHITYFLERGGEDNICLGSDFDGISYLPHSVYGVHDVHKILQKLSSYGICDKIIEKIAYKNILRIIGICL